MPRHTPIGSGTLPLSPMARSPQLARARLYLEQAAPHPRRCPPADVESLRVPPSRRAPQSGTRLRRHRAAPLGRRPSVSSHRKGGRRAHRAAPIFGRPQSGRPSDHRAVAAAHHARCRRAAGCACRSLGEHHRNSGFAALEGPGRMRHCGLARPALRSAWGGTQRHERRPKPTHRGGGWLAPSDREWITSCHLRDRSVPAGQGMDPRGGPPATSGELRRPAGAPARTLPSGLRPDLK